MVFIRKIENDQIVCTDCGKTAEFLIFIGTVEIEVCEKCLHDLEDQIAMTDT